MPKEVLSAQEFVKEYNRMGAGALARRYGLHPRNVKSRAARFKGRGFDIRNPVLSGVDFVAKYPGQLISEIKNGICIVAADCHYWPSPPSLMHRALVKFCKDFKPVEVILNGDVVDCATISRHPPLGWKTQPTVQDEIEAAQERLHEIELACYKARKRWPIGNHDERYERHLAQKAPELIKVAGTALKDHFPNWEPCYSVLINNDLLVTHNFKGGKHAPYNNSLHAGISMITSHLHNAQVRAITDYRETRWGADTGCIADPHHLAFEYLRNNPSDWREGFLVLTFVNSRLMQPELVLRWDNENVQFRGEVIHV